MKHVFLYVALVLLCVPGLAFAQQPAPASLPDLAERLLPSVVNISSTQKVDEITQQQLQQIQPFPDFPRFPEGSPFNDLFDQMQRSFPMPQQGQIQIIPPSALGSGFIMDVAKGLIITNNHVIAGADEIKVTLHDDTVLSATLLGSDEKTDIAVLKVDLKGQKVTAAPFGNSEVVRVGESIFAIGNPFGLGGTVTTGIISARARDINAGPYDDFLQTDASINRGNSGGPMFNMQGQVIGINSAIFSPTGGSVGIGFAIPSNLAKPVIDQLVKYGKTRRGWLGVKIQTVTPDIAKSLKMDTARGALVASISPDSPAAKAGIKAGDVILKFNGQDLNAMRQLPRLVAEAEIGGKADVLFWRNGQEKTVQVNLGELEKSEKKAQADEPVKQSAQDETHIPELGVNVAELTPALRQKYRIAPDLVDGVVVTMLAPRSDAARKDLRVGDVITQANQAAIQSAQDLLSQVSNAVKSGLGTVLLLTNRQGDVQFIGVTVDDAP